MSLSNWTPASINRWQISLGVPYDEWKSTANPFVCALVDTPPTRAFNAGQR
nr:hypothetical protein [Gilliamella sp. B3771]